MVERQAFSGPLPAPRPSPAYRFLLLEKTPKLLSKVRVSGGGRCNVTHACESAAQLVAHYPRGGRPLKEAFQRFGVADTITWFARRGVQLKTEADGRMFPTTDSSETIARALEEAARQAGVRILTRTAAEQIQPLPTGGFELALSGEGAAQLGATLRVSRLLVATGGHPKAAAYDWLRELGHTIAEPVPSLFTFNVPQSPLRELPGVSVPHARVVLAGEKLHYEGPLLVTHWGVSGPAVLKLSAWGARRLHELAYRSTALISWVPAHTDETLRPWVQQFRLDNGKKQVGWPPAVWPTGSPMAHAGGASGHRGRNAVERGAGQGPGPPAGAAATHPAPGAGQNDLQGRVCDLWGGAAGRNQPKNPGKPPGTGLVFCGRGTGCRWHHGRLQLPGRLDHGLPGGAGNGHHPAPRWREICPSATHARVA